MRRLLRQPPIWKAPQPGWPKLRARTRFLSRPNLPFQADPRAFSGKVDTGFPSENATTKEEEGAFRFRSIGKRPSQLTSVNRQPATATECVRGNFGQGRARRAAAGRQLSFAGFGCL